MTVFVLVFLAVIVGALVTGSLTSKRLHVGIPS